MQKLVEGLSPGVFVLTHIEFGLMSFQVCFSEPDLFECFSADEI